MNNLKNYYDVIVCGSGPAGLSAAAAASEKGASCLLVERLECFGKKLLASGNGRCNFSNILDRKEFMEAFGRNGRFMNDALNFASRDWLIGFLADRGVKSRLEDGFHYFPASGKAADILNAFLQDAKRNGADFLSGGKIEALNTASNVINSVTIQGEKIRCASVILACGGTAMPKLGGTNSGMELAKTLGHSIVKPFPAMAPIYLREEWVRKLTGVSLPDASLFFHAGRSKHVSGGELLFTHTGLSGPAAINLSGDAAEAFSKDRNITLYLQFDAKKDINAWKAEIDRMRKEEPKKLLRTVLAWTFTHSLADSICTELGLYDKKIYDLSNSERDRIAAFLSGAELHMEQLSPMDKAMAMKGGVSLKEVNPKTMESRLVKGVFFAGELLDLTGPCGGYNIQFAISSGRLAGASAAESCKSV